MKVEKQMPVPWIGKQVVCAVCNSQLTLEYASDARTTGKAGALAIACPVCENEWRYDFKELKDPEQPTAESAEEQ